MNPEPRVFQFIQPDENEYENQWKESFKQLVCIQYIKQLHYHSSVFIFFPILNI